MAKERRLFKRTDVSVEGHLEWGVRRRVGGIKQKRVSMTTVDLSVNGARVVLDQAVKLPVGASCLISLSDSSSPARVRTVQSDAGGRLLLSLELESPPLGFMQVIDQWISGREEGWRFDDSGWAGVGVVDDLFADRAA